MFVPIHVQVIVLVNVCKCNVGTDVPHIDPWERDSEGAVDDFLEIRRGCTGNTTHILVFLRLVSMYVYIIPGGTGGSLISSGNGEPPVAKAMSLK